MTFALLVGGFLGAINIARVRLALPENVVTGRARADALLGGSLVIFALAAVLVPLAGELLDALDISPETFRIAVGAVLAAGGLRALVWPKPAEEPILRGRLTALVPVAFPLVLTPELGLFLTTAGADESTARGLGALAVALAALAALGVVRRRDATASQLLLAGARLLGAVLVVVGAVLIINGIQDV